MPPQGTKFHLVLATALLAGCTGSIGGDGERAINDTVAKSLCVVDTPIRRLTRFEYNRTVRDLLGDTSNPADLLPPEEEVAGFNNQAAALTSSDLLIEQYMKVAEDVSARAVGNMGALIPDCDPDLDGNDVCASSFIQDFGKRVFRRPLSQDELERFESVFDWAIADADLGRFEDGIEVVLQVMLQSPSFLYRPELGERNSDRRRCGAIHQLGNGHQALVHALEHDARRCAVRRGRGRRAANERANRRPGHAACSRTRRRATSSATFIRSGFS